MAAIDQQSLKTEQTAPVEGLRVRLPAETLRTLLPAASNPADGEPARAGTLLGTVQGERVEIRAVRWFAADGFSSRTARFSSEFRVTLARLGEEAATEGLELIGWHCLRTNGSPAGLSADEIEFHRTYFPRTTDLALRLEKAQRAGYRVELYARSADGRFSQAEHRSGSFYLAADPARISEALEISVQVPAQVLHAIDEFYLRAYEVTRTLDELDFGARWKSWIGSLFKNEWWKKRWSRKSKAPSSGGTAIEGSPVVTASKASRLTGLGISSGLAAVPPRPSGPEIPADPPKPVETAAAPEAPSEPQRPQEQHIPAAAAASAEAVDEPMRLVAELRPGLRERWSGRRGLLLAASLTLLLAGAGALIAMRQHRTAAPAGAAQQQQTVARASAAGTTAALGFEPLQTNSGWELHWNSNLPAIQTAQNGVLLIRDGKRVKKLELDRSELSNGQVLYVPETQNVDFRLQVYTANGDLLSESVRVLPNAFAHSKLPAPARSTVAVKNPAPTEEEPASSLPLSSAPLKKIARQPTAARASASPSSPAYVPPQPLEKRMPNMPSFSTTRDGAGEIAVKVEIDATGHVTNASVASGDPGGGSFVLNRAALSAARAWTFEPARSQGRAVPSNFLILFRFTPQAP